MGKLLHGQLPIKRSMSAGSIRQPVSEDTLDTCQVPEKKQMYRRTMEADRQYISDKQDRSLSNVRMRSLSNSRSLTELRSKQRLASVYATAKDLKFAGKSDKLEELYKTELDVI